MNNGPLVVSVCFYGAFIIDVLIVIYAFFLIKRMGMGSLLGKTTLYAALSALVFGIHHLMEVFLEHVHNGLAIAESVEGVAAILMGIAVFQLYKLTRS